MAQANQTPIFAPAAACSAASGVVRIVDGVAISGVRALPIQFTKGLRPVDIRGDARRDAGAGGNVRSGCRNPFNSNDILLIMSDGRTALNATTDGLIHITIPVGMLQCNCSIIGDPDTREALVIDPGDEVTRILDLIGRHKLIVKVIVSTHAHIDHVGGLSKLHQYTGAPVLMHRDDLPLYHAMDDQAAFLGVHPPDLTEVDQLLKEGDVLRWGRFEAQVIHTPGHTQGSRSLYLPHAAGNITPPPLPKKIVVKHEPGHKTS